jgi:polar amino acid transport system substrate-binding protein
VTASKFFYRCLFASIILITFSFTQLHAAQSFGSTGKKTIIFTTAAPETIPLYNYYKALYTEAFRRMGHPFKIEYHPDVRTIINANSGKADGTCGRIYEFTADGKNPNLIRVDEPVTEFKSIAWTFNSSLGINGWESLKGFKCAYVRGNKYLESDLSKYVSEDDIFVAQDAVHALRLLLSGRVEIYIEMDALGAMIKSMYEFKHEPIMNSGQVTEINVYPYLHKQNVNLVPLLETTLKAMKADGAFDKIVKLAKSND